VIFAAGLPAIHRVLAAIDGALGGTLHEHEEVVWRTRIALQELAAAHDLTPLRS
jgi:hypothetical protein